MKVTEKYKTPQSFEQAIRSRLKELSKGDGAENARYQRQIAYSQLLRRLFLEKDVPWALKGGHALEIRLQRARGTKDIDLALKEAGFFEGDHEEKMENLKEVLQKKASLDIGDYFTFLITGPIMDLENAPCGGGRFHVEAKIGGKTFSKFHLDIGVGDVWIEPHDELVVKNHLETLGIKDFKVETINIEQHFAEKVHAYTVPREKPNSRVKDIVDMYLIVKHESMDKGLLETALEETFKRRATHELPEELEPPPGSWEKSFERMIGEVMDKKVGIKAAFEEIKEFLNSLGV
jgi:hypothetical protein